MERTKFGRDVPGFLSVHQVSEWTLEEEKVEQVVFRSAGTSLKLIPLNDGAVRVIRSKGIAHQVSELVYLQIDRDRCLVDGCHGTRER